jgi:rhodanese-related sulfurtransferase
MSSAIDQRVADVLARIHSLTVHEAAAFRDAGALLVDIRPREQRESFGLIPGALVIERNVLEWRLDPTSTHRHRIAAAHRGAIVVFCQQGYASILAVGELVALGVPEVYDLRAGFDAWAAARLPTATPSGPPLD